MNTVETPKNKMKRKNNYLSPCVVKLEQMNFKSNNTYKDDSTPTNDDKNLKSFVESTPKLNVEFSLELKKAINDRNILTSKTRKRVFEALDEIKTNADEESRKFKREKALLEIVNSEIKYVKHMEIIIDFFMIPIKEQKLLKIEDFQTVFGNIESIYKINKELLKELDQGPNNVANAFFQVSPFLKIYSVYACNFKNTLKLLQNSRLLNPAFAKFVESQETRPEVQNKLSALLITPIQRVPRYKLLLEQLRDLTSSTDPEYEHLTECLRKIEEAAEHINQIVEDHENMQRLLELQRCLCSGEPNIITPGRKLRKEGILMKVSVKQTQSEKYYVVLMSDIIMFNKMKKNEPKVNSLKCTSIFPLNKCKIEEMLDKGSFRINCQGEEIALYHKQLSEVKTWIRHLKQSIQNNLDDRKTLRKESSSRRPVKRKDLVEYHEIGLSPGRPLKKRRISTEEIQQNTATTSNDLRISKRKSIHSFGEFRKADQEPGFKSNLKPISNGETSNTDTSKAVFIFGQQHTHKPFKIGNILGGVGSSIKRIFGFRN